MLQGCYGARLWLFHVLLISQSVSVCLSLSKLMLPFTTGSPQRASVRDIEVNLPDGFPDGLAEFHFYNVIFGLVCMQVLRKARIYEKCRNAHALRHPTVKN